MLCAGGSRQGRGGEGTVSRVLQEAPMSIADKAERNALQRPGS